MAQENEEQDRIEVIIDAPNRVTDEDETVQEIKQTNTSKDDFTKIFKPIYYCTTIFCVRKYSFKNNIFKPITKLDILASVLINTGMSVICFITLREFTEIFLTPLVSGMYMVIYFQYVLQYILLSMTQLWLKHDNILLISTLQEIYTFLYDQQDVLKIRMHFLIPIMTYTFVYFLLIITKYVLDPLWGWNRCIFIGSTLIFDLEMVYAAFVLYFIAYNTRKWTEAVKKKENEEDEPLLDEMKSMLRIFEKLIKGVQLVQKVFQLMILYHFVTNFTQTLCYLEILLLWMDNHNVETDVIMSHLIGVLLWIFKGLVIEIAVCYCGEYLYRRMEIATEVIICTNVQTNSDIKQRFAKNIFRFSKTRFSKINACGVFIVDGALPLRLTGVVATYTIVLLQFAFL